MGLPKLWVEVSPGVAELAPEATRAAIADELKVEVVSSKDAPHFGHVNVIGTRGPAVIVRYESADGVTKLERRMPLPIDEQRRTLVVSWVVSNLVRNEAAEILRDMSLRAPALASSDAPAPASDSSGGTGEAPGTDVTERDANADHASAPATAAPAPARTPEPPANVPKTAQPAVPPERRLGPPRILNASLVSPHLALQGDAKDHAYYLSLGGFYNHIGGLDGFGLTWLVDRFDEHINGVAVSGLWIVGARTRGVAIAGLGVSSPGDMFGAEMAGLWVSRSGCAQGLQVSGLWSSAGAECSRLQHATAAGQGDALEGVQLSGLVSYVGAGFQGAQISGLASLNRGRSKGVQLAGALALSSHDFDGVQTGMLGNVGTGRLVGVQLSGAFNIQAGSVAGAQITGAYNHADELAGLQLGVVNYARQARGVQLGVVNVASQQSGFAIGLVNWAHSSRIQPIYFFQNPGYHNVGYRMLTEYTSSTISFGYDGSRERARTHFGVGGHYAFGRFDTGVEFGYGWVLEQTASHPRDRAHELDLIGRVSVELIRNWFSAFAGGGAALPVAGEVPIEPAGLVQLGVAIL
jgi:hypothetical protein